MSNERFFRMLSIALLGAFAIAFLPDLQASVPVVEIESVLPVEIQAVQEVNQINAGRFNAAVAGELNSLEATLDPHGVLSLSQLDPNL